MRAGGWSAARAATGRLKVSGVRVCESAQQHGNNLCSSSLNTDWKRSRVTKDPVDPKGTKAFFCGPRASNAAEAMEKLFVTSTEVVEVAYREKLADCSTELLGGGCCDVKPSLMGVQEVP